MELKYLNSYSPAEILLLRNGYTVNLIDILKYTVIDLLFKDPIQDLTGQQVVMGMLFVYLIMYYLQKIGR